MVIDDMISGGHARALLAVSNGDTQYALAMKAFDEKLSVREVEKLIKNIGSEETKSQRINQRMILFTGILKVNLKKL